MISHKQSSLRYENSTSLCHHQCLIRILRSRLPGAKNFHLTLASAQGFAPRIRINGRDVTEKRTHGHDTWFAFWNLNNNLMKPQDLFDAYSHAVYWRIVLIQGYTGAEKNFARDNDKFKCRHMQAHAGTIKRGPWGSFRIDMVWFSRFLLMMSY